MNGNNEARDNPCYCIGLRRASGAISRRYDRALASVNLSVAQYSLLNDIHFLKTCNQTELARHANLDRTTIIRNLRILREKGLIAETSGENRRNHLIALTASGRQAIAQGLGAWSDVQRQLEREIGREEIECFMKVIKAMESMD